MLSSSYPSQYYSVEWQGFLKAPTTETYRLFIDTYNTSFVQLYLNGTLLIQNDYKGKGSINMHADVNLIKDTLSLILLRYSEKLGPTKLIMSWESDSRDY